MRAPGRYLKAFTALTLGVATAAIFTTPASARVGTDIVPGQFSSVLEVEQAMIQAPTFSKITSPAQLYAGQLEPAKASPISYLSWDATGDTSARSRRPPPIQSPRDGGPSS